MKNLIDTIKNIWRIDELRTRILITLGLLLVYRIGSFIVLPGVDSASMAANASGRRWHRGSWPSSPVGPSPAPRSSRWASCPTSPHPSSCSWGIAVPAVQKMQKEESGRRKINQYTRYLTILICVFQAPGYIYTTIEPDARPDSQFWLFTSIVILSASTLFVMWLGERITERGLGNGIS
jgi:preprotein translocase subunit SecY